MISIKNKSIWLEGITFSDSKNVERNINVDVLIIGGGITGLSTAFHLINCNLKTCVVEKNLIGHAVTSRTTGKLTFLQENIYSKLKDKANLYYQSQKEAIQIVENIVNKYNINCDFKKVDSYLYTDKKEKIKKIKKEEEYLKKLNINYRIHSKLPNDLNCEYAISVSNTAIFHPIKYLVKLKEIVENSGINVYENSNVDSIKKENGTFVCTINNCKVCASKIVIASHYPYFLSHFFMPIRTYIEKSYISASSVKKSMNFSAISISNPIKSMRYYNNSHKSYFIYLSQSHNLSNNYNYRKNFSNLIDDLSNKNWSTDFIWSNQDIMTEDNLPYIGFIDDNLLIGTGYNTWGMTNGSMAGKILSDLVQNKNNKYKDIFNPKRNMKLMSILQYPLNISYNAKSFIENKIIKNKCWYNKNVSFTTINGENVGIYVDEKKKEHIVRNICPHLKCSLVFNEIEKTWDCPCHASRFDIDGNCISGPSNKNITFKK